MVCLWLIFSRKFCKKKPYSIPSHITFYNLIPVDKTEYLKYLKGTISLGHCRGHNYIILVFYFDGFYDNYQHLFSKKKKFQIKKMGCFFSRNDEPKIKISDCTPPGDDFNY